MQVATFKLRSLRTPIGCSPRHGQEGGASSQNEGGCVFRLTRSRKSGQHFVGEMSGKMNSTIFACKALAFSGKSRNDFFLTLFGLFFHAVFFGFWGKSEKKDSKTLAFRRKSDEKPNFEGFRGFFGGVQKINVTSSNG